MGVLRALERRGIAVDGVAGTSIGAFVGALYASGASAEEVERIGRATNWNNLSEIRLSSWPGIFSARRLEAYMNALLGGLCGTDTASEVEFDDLRRRFVCIAADLATGEEAVFETGPVAPAVRASCAVPGLFEPSEYAGRTLIDGGVVNNLPTDHARRLGADVVVAVDVEGAALDVLPRSPIEVLVQVIRIQGARITASKRAAADVLIRPDVGRIGITELDRSAEAIRLGRLAGESDAAAVEEVLIARSLGALLAAPAGGVGARASLPVDIGGAAAETPVDAGWGGHGRLLELARAAAARGEWEVVLEATARVRSFQGRAESERLAAAAALHLGLVDEAVVHAERALRTDDAPAEAWVLMGLSALAAGRDGAAVVAVTAFDEAARRGRSEPFWRAWALEASGDRAGALAAYRAAAASGSDAARVRLAWEGDAEAAGGHPAARTALAFRAAASGDRAAGLGLLEGIPGTLPATLREWCSR